jgi:uncharacterized repeat protein (TIGR03803 family)
MISSKSVLIAATLVFAVMPSPATTTFATLVSLDGTHGTGPNAPLVQGFDGNLYGTTYNGGANDNGTVFKITAGGKLTTLHSFDGTDGATPQGGLVQATTGTSTGQLTMVGPTTTAQMDVVRSSKSPPRAR